MLRFIFFCPKLADLIDPVKDPIPSSLYKEEEDPLLYVSKKTGRGPLTRNWLNQPQKSVMCAYKKISVEFKYWGMQVRNACPRRSTHVCEVAVSNSSIEYRQVMSVIPYRHN